MAEKINFQRIVLNNEEHLLLNIQHHNGMS